MGTEKIKEARDRDEVQEGQMTVIMELFAGDVETVHCKLPELQERRLKITRSEEYRG